MDIDELRTVQSKERRKDSLQHLRDSFYDDVAAYIAGRKEERDERAASVDKPFSDSTVRKLSDEIETAEEVAESLYERRVGKVVKLASFAAADAPVDTEGMTTQELDLFEDLVARIRSNKEAVLDVLADAPGAAGDVDSGNATADADTSANADAAAGAPDPESGADASERASPTDVAEPAPTTADAAAAPDPTPGDDEADGGGGLLADAMGGDDAAGRDASGRGEAEPGREPDGSREVANGPSAAAASSDTNAANAERTPNAANEADAGDTAGTDAAGDPPTPPETPSDDPADARPGGDADPRAAAPDSGSESAAGTDPSAGTDAGPDDDRTTVRITRDVGRILGVDEREYDLESEDVVSLPAANAGPLVERDAAEPLE